MAVLSRTKQALLNSIAKGNLEHRASVLTGSVLSIAPIVIAPQKVVDVTDGDTTRDTYQRKIFYNGSGFFILYYDDTAVQLNYVASADGISWNAPSNLLSRTVFPGGNADVSYPTKGAKDSGGLSVDVSVQFTQIYAGNSSSRWMPFIISGLTLVARTPAALGLGTAVVHGGHIVSNLNATYDDLIYHRQTPNRIGVYRSPATNPGFYATDVPFDTASGGNVLLPYKTSSPFNMLALMKGGDTVLYWNTVNGSSLAFINASSTSIATLGVGFSDFCACSEAQNLGDPERVHLVYIKSTGELCYNKFENDAWGNEVVLASSGATYPVIATGKNGRLYVFYVKGGVVKLLKYDGASWGSETTLFPSHTYNNPTYLSSNQNVQNGQICLVWTEGTSTPYGIWFCTIGD